MTTTEVSPVTETEMRNFAERMVTSFVSLSEQAKELVAVRSELNTLRSEMNYQKDRLEAVLNENSNLQSQIQTVVAERDNARREQADNLALAKQYESERDQARVEVERLRNTANWRQEKINELEQSAMALRGQVSDALSKATIAEAKLAKMQEYFRSVFEPDQPKSVESSQAEQSKPDTYIPF